MCPHCSNVSKRQHKRGFYSRSSSRTHRVQRYQCYDCQRFYSDQTSSLTYGQRKPHINQPLYRLLNAGVSQRRCAFILGVNPKTVARIICRMAAFARHQHRIELAADDKKVECVVFDEMETFEHSKCKPLSIIVAVEEGTRRILTADVAQMPAKGHLAAIALKRYGFRKDFRGPVLLQSLKKVSKETVAVPRLKSDQCPRYPKAVRHVFPHSMHETFKGRRGCVVGQGELKAGGFDPLFSLNHTCAMFRDNLKRLSRRSWCTTKCPDRLADLLVLYSCYHNQRLRKDRQLVRIFEHLPRI